MSSEQSSEQKVLITTHCVDTTKKNRTQSRLTPRLNYSNYFITINPNKPKSSFKTREEYKEFKKQFKVVVQKLHQIIYPRFILLQSAKNIPDKFQLWREMKLEDRIEGIKIDISFEIGRKKELFSRSQFDQNNTLQLVVVPFFFDFSFTLYDL